MERLFSTITLQWEGWPEGKDTTLWVWITSFYVLFKHMSNSEVSFLKLRKTSIARRFNNLIL